MSHMLNHFKNSDLKQNVLLVKNKEIHYFSLLLFCQPFKLDLNELKSKEYVKKKIVLVTLVAVTIDCSLNLNFV